MAARDERPKQSGIEKYNEEFRFNKNAFDDVMGDPYALEPSLGNYQKLQRRSSIRVANNEFDMGKATKTPGQPNVQDFYCDVDRCITDVLTKDEQVRFTDTYISEYGNVFTPKERMRIEQKVGKLFRLRKISPVSKYFNGVRRESVRAQERMKRNGSSNTSRAGQPALSL